MRTILHVLFFVLLAMTSSSFECTEKEAGSAGQSVTITAYAPTWPVLRGLAVNPFLRLAIALPEGAPANEIKEIQCTLNAAAVGSVEKIEVYRAGADGMLAGSAIASTLPGKSAFSIPLNLSLSAGPNLVWLSVVLKADAGIDQPIELGVTRLIDAKGKKYEMADGQNTFVKRAGVALRRAGDDNVDTYRIPGIIATDKGTLIAVYDIRYLNSRDLPGHIDVGMSRSTDGGKTWEPMKTIMDMGPPHENNGIGDPTILFDPATKKIWVAALWSKGNRSIAGSGPGLTPDETGQFVLVSSSDDGLTWSAPYSITPQIKNPAWKILFQGPGNGIAMADGKLVFPSQYWELPSNIPFSNIIYSADHGATWTCSASAPKSNTTESQVVETTPGTLMLNMRDNRGSFRSVATTSNMGTTWKEHPTSYSALPDPVCMGSLIKAKVNVKGALKEVLFFSNPNTSSGRYNITIKASLDLGETWLPANQLLIDERKCYGYSALTQIDEHTIGLLYEGTKELYFVKVKVGEVVK